MCVVQGLQVRRIFERRSAFPMTDGYGERAAVHAIEEDEGVSGVGVADPDHGDTCFELSGFVIHELGPVVGSWDQFGDFA